MDKKKKTHKDKPRWPHETEQNDGSCTAQTTKHKKRQLSQTIPFSFVSFQFKRMTNTHHHLVLAECIVECDGLFGSLARKHLKGKVNACIRTCVHVASVEFTKSINQLHACLRKLCTLCCCCLEEKENKRKIRGEETAATSFRLQYTHRRRRKNLRGSLTSYKIRADTSALSRCSSEAAALARNRRCCSSKTECCSTTNETACNKSPPSVLSSSSSS